ncbi:FAD-binding protein [Leptolyngbya sp. KIOST-1]|uniref:FAD-binding protein n=1 Tax=Leptolyngbya sp. KIOST-1 TaxID=1229172 RepID=UPI00056B851A|nr:FAD-binding protein [Leptolyngbya sp. KIOST-1]
MRNIEFLTSKNLSFYRTNHKFEHYSEFKSVEEFKEILSYADENNLKVYILGNGSNTFFCGSKIKTLVLKNNLEKEIKVVSKTDTHSIIRASSSVLAIDILKICFSETLDAFYYLSSVPATIGGALAMNAGRGKHFNRTIYDFVEHLEVFDHKENRIKILKKSEVVKGYRETIFTGIQSQLILGVEFKFPKHQFEGNPILERCKWSKENQDNAIPNCGSVFSSADPKILESIKGLRIGEARFSKKTSNWISNKSSNYIYIYLLIVLAKILHLVKKKKAKLEIILVD